MSGGTINCTKCGMIAESEDCFCSKCGNRLKAEASASPEIEIGDSTALAGSDKKFLTGIVIGILALVAIIIILIALNSPKAGSQSTQRSTDSTNAVENASRAADQAMNEAMNLATHAEHPGVGWTYSTLKDEMTDGEVRVARATSTNSISQSFPYEGTTTLDLIIRKHPRMGTNVYFVLSSGQLLCNSYDGCTGTVRFDGGPARTIGMMGASDNSSDTAFVNGAYDFIERVQNSKRLVVALDIYQSGAPNFTFDIGGLKWGKKAITRNATAADGALASTVKPDDFADGTEPAASGSTDD